jgi:hypothetical protein
MRNGDLKKEKIGLFDLVEDFYSGLELGSVDSDEYDRCLAIRDKLIANNVKTGYSIKDDKNELVDPDISAFTGIKIVILNGKNIQMESPSHIELIKWIDSVLGVSASKNIFDALTIQGDKAILSVVDNPLY